MNILEWFTTETAYSASFLDIHVILDTNGQLSTRLYDKRDDFNIAIINFPHLDSNISFSPAYGGYISQLICYARACSLNSDYFTIPSYFEYSAIKSRIFKRIVSSYLSRWFSEDINIMWKSILSVAHIWREMALEIRFGFKVDYCFTIMSYDVLV
jgi:hypothetical protein